MRAHIAVILSLALVGCISAFAPNLRPRRHHAGIASDTPPARCFDCHPSEHEVRVHGREAHAPIVADWMLDEARSCQSCHRIRSPLAPATAQHAERLSGELRP